MSIQSNSTDHSAAAKEEERSRHLLPCLINMHTYRENTTVQQEGTRSLIFSSMLFAVDAQILA